MAHPGGRPKKFNTPEELEIAVKHYFNTITKDYALYDNIIVGYEDEEKKKPVYKKEPRLNNANEQVFETEYFEIPSITGLCVFLNINKDTWNEYSKHEEYSDSITRAKEIIEKYNVEQLYRKEQVNGVIFNLKNNFGWKDKTEVETTGETTVTNKIDLTGMSTEDLKEMLK